MAEPVTLYVDDPTIADESPLWRQIPPRHFVLDENIGRFRPSKAAFEDHPNGTPMSVVLGQEVLDGGRTADSLLLGLDGFGLVSFSARLARARNQGIMRKPIPDEPAHAEVFGRKTDSVRKAFAKGCEWVVPPPTIDGSS